VGWEHPYGVEVSTWTDTILQLAGVMAQSSVKEWAVETFTSK